MHNLPYSKLKLNKLERIKSRYKTPARLSLNQNLSEGPSYDIGSQQFAKVCNRLSNHFNANLLPRRVNTQKDQRAQGHRTNKKHVNQSYCKMSPSNIKSLSQSHDSTKKQLSLSNQPKRPTSLHRNFLPSVKIIVGKGNVSKSSKSIKPTQISGAPILNRNYSFMQGLMLHAHNLATVYNRLRRNLTPQSIMSAIQQYVLQSNNADISKLDLLFLVQQAKIQCRTLIFLERVLLVLIVQCQIKHLKNEKTTLKILLHMICDQYVTLMNILYSQNFNIEKPYVKKVLNLIGTQQDNFKGKKLFSENQELILKINGMLKGNHSFRSYFHEHLPKLSMFNVNQSFYTLLEFYSFTLAQHFTICPEIVKFMSTCPSPYLHSNPTKQYTLVMDLDETLIHYNQSKATLLVRPHCKKFITQLSEFFELGVFTCAMPDYANWVLNELKCPVQFRLYRYHTVQTQNAFFKDLSRLGRDLKKVILVDNIAQNFQLTPKNGIHIKTWTGDCEDKQLLILMQQLLTLIKLAPEDIRTCLHSIIKSARTPRTDQ